MFKIHTQYASVIARRYFTDVYLKFISLAVNISFVSHTEIRASHTKLTTHNIQIVLHITDSQKLLSNLAKDCQNMFIIVKYYYIIQDILEKNFQVLVYQNLYIWMGR